VTQPADPAPPGADAAPLVSGPVVVPGGVVPGGVVAGGVVAAGLVAELIARGQTLAVAESLTGGLLAASIVDIPGCSAVFRGGLVVYATDLKAALAGVPVHLLAERGPVDPEVALALARGARDRCSADWGLGTTGVAGPDAQHGKPPGTAFVAVAGPHRGHVRALALAGDRPAIRAATVAAALDLLATQLSHG
jgi:nicotinamide-nucleotide amidase